ncbi:MAG: cob(I)yrinic acid a,c-diamide adenosyltransferase [Candidatus Dormibacteria bacterium]
MQNVDSIVTKGGDAGTTGLLYGGRVPKDDLHTEACGALDEAISALGLARSLAQDRATQVLIEELERELFTAGAELATLPSAYDTYKKHFPPIDAKAIQRLEDEVHRLEKECPLPDGFVLPGGTPDAAAVDLARTVIRRVERWTVKLHAANMLANPLLLQYFNRLSDYLFMLARSLEGESRITAK